MKLSQAKEYLPFVQAAAEGKIIQFKTKVTGEWRDCLQFDTSTFADDYDYRIKPESKLRPWKPEEVPVGAIVRSGSNRWLITACWNDKPFLNGSCECAGADQTPSLKMLADSKFEHSTDHGKTWLPCGVQED